jgi:hypothetical protein
MPPVGAGRGGKFVGWIGLDHDDVGGMPRQSEVIGDRGADDTAADDRDLGHCHFFLDDGVAARCAGEGQA